MLKERRKKNTISGALENYAEKHELFPQFGPWNPESLFKYTYTREHTEIKGIKILVLSLWQQHIPQFSLIECQEPEGFAILILGYYSLL